MELSFFCTLLILPFRESWTPVRLERLKIFLSPCVNLGDFLDNWIFNTPSVIDVSGLRSLYIQKPKVKQLEHFSRLFHLCSMRLEILEIELDSKSLLLFHSNLFALIDLPLDPITWTCPFYPIYKHCNSAMAGK